MKNTVLLLSVCLTFVLVANGQDEFILINDFESELGDWRRDADGAIQGWVLDSWRFTTPDEPHHGGQSAGRMDVLHEGGWASSYYQFPVPVDAAEAGEFRMWVYSEDIFRLRVELGPGLMLGFRNYGWDDVGTWKEFIFWIQEEQAVLWNSILPSADELRLIINPSESTIDGVDYPNGFEGTIYIDDMRFKKRTPVEREFLTLIGFNDIFDEDFVTLTGGGTYFEVVLSDDPVPTEGEGILFFDWTQGWNQNIRINLRDFPEILEYDRIHVDIFVDSTASWATTSLRLNKSVGPTIILCEYHISPVLGNDWAEMAGQYGHTDYEGYDGFSLDSLLPDIGAVFDDPNGTITVTVTSQGGSGIDGAMAYIDNIRLSRPVEKTSIKIWELW